MVKYSDSIVLQLFIYAYTPVIGAWNDTHIEERKREKGRYLLKGVSKESTYEPHKNSNLNKTVRVARIRNKQEVIQEYRVRACVCV